jgi:DNA (cytosine-5)-methyltransferase 1
MNKTVKIADLFCGAGGTSTGACEAVEALGYRPMLTAINHWPVAVETHTRNHPDARHFCASLDALNPRDLFAPGELDLLWASPECTHHSVARGGKPINEQSRATAWCVIRWADALMPPTILVENVPEFVGWGGLTLDGRPMKSKKGATFAAWVGALESLGYRVEWKVLCAANYGDPTTRRRLFVQAVRGRRKIVWPDPTHAAAGEGDLLGGRKPWVAAKQIIDWDIPGESIYERKRPLKPKTMARIMDGLQRFGLRPFIQTMEHGGSVRDADRPLPTITTAKGGAFGLTEPYLIHVAHHGKRKARSVEQPLPTVAGKGGTIALAHPYLIEMRGTCEAQCRASARSIGEPLGTVTAGGVHHGLVEPCLLPQQSCGVLRPVSEPAPTVSTAGAIALVEPFLVEYYGNGRAQSVNEPLGTATTRDRFGLARPQVVVDGNRYVLDIRFRMLQAHELAAAQGFPRDYQFSGTKTQAIKQIGNAVPRHLARALVLAAVSQNNQIGEFLKEAA